MTRSYRTPNVRIAFGRGLTGRPYVVVVAPILGALPRTHARP